MLTAPSACALTLLHPVFWIFPLWSVQSHTNSFQVRPAFPSHPHLLTPAQCWMWRYSAQIAATSCHVGALQFCQTKPLPVELQRIGQDLCFFVLMFSLKLYAELISPTLFTSSLHPARWQSQRLHQKHPGHFEDKGMIYPVVLLHCTSLLVSGENSANALCNLNN